MPECTAVLDHFDAITNPELVKIISCMHKTTCSSDPFPTKLLMDHLEAIIGNLSLTTAVFPTSCKSSIVAPLLKTAGLDCEVLKNYRPVCNLCFYQKLLKKLFLFVYYNISLIIT